MECNCLLSDIYSQKESSNVILLSNFKILLEEKNGLESNNWSLKLIICSASILKKILIFSALTIQE